MSLCLDVWMEWRIWRDGPSLLLPILVLNLFVWQYRLTPVPCKSFLQEVLTGISRKRPNTFNEVQRAFHFSSKILYCSLILRNWGTMRNAKIKIPKFPLVPKKKKNWENSFSIQYETIPKFEIFLFWAPLAI